MQELPDWSIAPKAEGKEQIIAIKEAGFEGIQTWDKNDALDLGIGTAGMGRINLPCEAEPFAKQSKDQGYQCMTVHVGWGLESDSEIDALVNATIEASIQHDLPIFIETHRSTITQDIWRTVEITKRFPGVRFNGDFSHWYTGLEMVYGGIETKMHYAQSVFDRTRFLHGRIGSPGSMQTDIGATFEDAILRENVQHIAMMWTASMGGFLKDAKFGDVLVFAPEILPASAHYARTFPDTNGRPREETDRWHQALIYKQIAEYCFAEAQRQ